MALELINDTLKFDQVIGEGQSQALVDKDMNVPDIKPDIAKILSVEGKANITGKEVEQDRIAVDGTVDFSILYSTSDEPQPIYSIAHSDNFSQYIEIPGAMPKMEADVKCNIEHIDFNRINGRKLNIQCVINMDGKVKDKVPVDIVKEVEGIQDIQLLRDTVAVDDVFGENAAQTVVRGSIQIPTTLPQADEVIKCRAMIHKREVSLEEGKVNVSGSVFVPVLFLSRADENVDIYKVDDDFVFTYTMEIPGITPDMTCNIDYSIDEINTEIKENEDNERRQIDIEGVIGINARVLQRREYPVVVDMYAPSTRIEPEKVNIDYEIFYGKNTSEAMIKENLQVPKDSPGMEKVYDLVCNPIVTDCKVIDDKVIVEGVAGCDIIYLVRGEGKLVHSFSDEVPFKTSVVIPGCKTGMKSEVEVNVESMDCTILTKDEVEVKITLDCLVMLYEKLSKEFIIKAEELEAGPPVHKPSITIYMVQPKDTLWNIAKKYCTTIEDIVKVNEIEDPDKITPGMKLIIPKKL